VLGSGIGWMVRDRTARHAAVDQQVRESLARAWAWFAQDKLALAHQELAEAKGRIGNDRAALQGLADEVEALDAEITTLQTCLDLIDRADDAEISALIRPAGAMATEPEKKAPSKRGSSFDLDPARAVPFRLRALACYHVRERDDWTSLLERRLREPAQVAR